MHCAGGRHGGVGRPAARHLARLGHQRAHGELVVAEILRRHGLHLGGGDAVRTPTAEVRKVYSQWCHDEGEEEMNSTAFGRELRSRWGIRAMRSHGRRQYVGMALLADDEDTDEPEQWWSK